MSSVGLGFHARPQRGKAKDAAAGTSAVTTVKTTAADTTAADATTTTPATEAAVTEAATLAAAEEKLPPVTLSIWMGCPGVQRDTEEVHAYLQKQINECLPNTEINWTLLGWAEYSEKWTKALAAGETIDMSWYGFVRNLSDDVSDGTLLAMDPYLDKYGPHIKSYYGDQVLDIHRNLDGKLYFIPAWQGLCANRYVIYLRKNVADSVSPETVKAVTDTSVKNQFDASLAARQETLDAVTRLFKEAKEAGTIGRGTRGIPDLAYFTNTYATLDGGGYAIALHGDDTFKAYSKPESDYVKLLYKTAAEWYDSGYIPADILSLDTSRWADWAEDGENGLMYVIGGTQGYEDPAKVTSEQWGIDIVSLPLIGTDTLVLGTPTGEVLPMTSKNPERAIQFLDLFFAPEGKEIYRTFVYGLEGKHYIRTTDNDTIDQLTGTGEPGSDWVYGKPVWVIGTCEDIFNTAAGTVNIYKLYKSREATAYVSPLLTFSVNNEDVAVEQAQIKAVVDEYSPILSSGIKGTGGWEAYYDEYIQKLKLAGIDAYMAEVQKQVDSFVKEHGSKW